MLISIAKDYTWEMGHALFNHNGKCYHPHGHNYRLEVEVSGEVDEESGMVLDFAQLDDLIEPLIEEGFDHQFLCNDTDTRAFIDPFGFTRMDGEPTAENLVRVFWQIIQGFERSRHPAFERAGGDGISDRYGVTLERLTLWETDKARATIRRS